MRLRDMRTAIEKVVVVNKVIELASAHRARRGLVTVDEYLTDKGVDEAGRKRWSSAFGRKVASVVRSLTGREPRTTWIVWRGRVTRVFAYVGAVYLGTAWALYEAKINEG
jgi:hypothetical protein